MGVRVYVCMCVYMEVCEDTPCVGRCQMWGYMRMYICVCIRRYVCIHVSVYVYICVYTYVCMYTRVQVSL